MHTRNVSALLAVLAALAWGDAAQSQTWPQKPVRGNTDGIARLIAQPLGEAFGQQFLVENKPGAAGAIATEMVARSPGDGYTLLMGTPSQIAIVPQLTKTPYDPVKDLAPISVIGTNPYVLVVNARLPVQTLAEFIAHVRRQPDKVAYAAPVFGGLSHLSMIVFMKRAGLEMTPVSYKGGAAPLADVVAGHVPVYFATLSEAVSQARGGAVRLLAVSSERRVTQLPDVPTFAESGFPGFKVLTWNGLMAPAAVAAEITDRIAGELGQGREVCRAPGRLRGRSARQHAGAVRRADRGRHRIVGRGGQDCGPARKIVRVTAADARIARSHGIGRRAWPGRVALVYDRRDRLPRAMWCLFHGTAPVHKEPRSCSTSSSKSPPRSRSMPIASTG